jgi:hypothetical protein
MITAGRSRRCRVSAGVLVAPPQFLHTSLFSISPLVISAGTQARERFNPVLSRGPGLVADEGCQTSADSSGRPEIVRILIPYMDIMIHIGIAKAGVPHGCGNPGMYSPGNPQGKRKNMSRFVFMHGQEYFPGCAGYRFRPGFSCGPVPSLSMQGDPDQGRV